MMDNEALIQLRDVVKVYQMGRKEFVALKGVTLDIYAAEFVSIVGPSGSGKSTILNMITGIAKPTSGRVWVGGVAIDRLSENELAKWRRDNVGIVFQFFQLLPTLTALENVVLPLDLMGKVKGKEKQKWALECLAQVGLESHAHHLPSELSGGEQQRVAIARALANDPPILIADEPTGNLDSEAGEAVVQLLADLHRQGKTVILITHDRSLAGRAERIVQVLDGHIVE
ncbi:MAG: ABC transporter ATP-binding protein [Anaerolineae bacterium]